MRTIAERTNSEDEMFRLMGDAWSNNLRVSIPGIVVAFDAVTQTVTVQPALRENIRDENGNVTSVNLPLLVDVPIVFPRAGNFVLTMPVTAGDECLVIFADFCLDAWFSSSGIQNQIEKRRHDLSDGIAIIGLWSQPNKLVNYSTTSAQLRNEAGTDYIELKNAQINLVSTSVKINGKEFSTHTHSDPQGGSTGGVT